MSPSPDAASAAAGERFSRAWILLLGLGGGGRVLEVSEDGGARAAALRARGARVVCLRKSEDAAAALRARGLDARAAGRAAGDPAPCDAAVVSAALGRTPGSEWTTADLAPLLGQVLSLVRPGGTIVLSLPNPLYGLPLLARVAGRLQGAGAGAGTQRGIPRGRRLAAPLGTAAIHRALAAAGIEGARVFAPLPSAWAPKFLVPLGDAAAVTYFFRHMLPRAHGALRRAAAAAVALAAECDLVDRVMPSFEVAGRKPA